MVIQNAKVLIGKKFVDTALTFRDTIVCIGAADDTHEIFDATGCYVLPGLVDVHTHGAAGEDFSDGRQAGLQTMMDYYAAHGVTSVLATTMTLGEAALTDAMRTLQAFKGNRGAKLAGIHLEGPFLSREKRGAQAAEHLRQPDIALFYRFNEASGNRIKLVTVACEEEGAMDFIRQVSKTCAVSVGHTCADYDAAMKAFEAGACGVTHLYNGMPPLHHRQPGVIGAALDSCADAELICDGLHVHPAVIRATFAMFGDKVNLISDSLRCAGMEDGDYELGGQPIRLRNGKATLTGTDTLAGSAISLLDGVRNAVKFGIPLEDAVYAASTAPAKRIGLTQTGCIQVGNCADLIVLDEKLELRAVFIDGVPQQINTRRV